VARILGAFPAALIAARGGMSANAFYRQLQELGMGARRSEALAIFKAAKEIVAKSPDEPFSDISAAPTDERLTPWPTRVATGVKQVVTLTYRDRTTGTVAQTYYSVTSDTGLAREEALASAIDAYSDHAEEYNQDLIGAIHTGAYRLTPVGL